MNGEELVPPAKGVVPFSEVSERISGRKISALPTGLAGIPGVTLRACRS